MEKDYKIPEIIDIEKISKILKSFSKLTNIVTAILDLDGNILVQTGWREICTCYHREHSKTAMNCKKSDTFLAGKLSEGGKYNVYKCLNGLVDIAVPIVIRGKHIGNLFTGQFLFEPPNIETFRAQSVKYNFNTAKYLDALSKVPVIKESEVKDILIFLLNMTEMLCEIGLNNINQIETNKALEESKIFNETLLNTSSDIIYVYDIQSKSNVYSNNGIEKILGYSVSEIKKMGNSLISSLMHPDDFEIYLNSIIPRYISAKDNEFIEHEYRMKHKNGKWLWLHSKETIFLRNQKGEPIQIFGNINDITASKNTKEEILKIKKILEETGKLAKVGGWEFDVETGEGTWTKEVARIHDLNAEDAPNVEIGLSYYCPSSRERIETALKQCLEKGKAYDLELELISAKGNHKWVRTIGKPIKKNGKIIKVTGSLQDISKIKAVENQLKENSNFLDTIIEDAAVSMWISDKKGTAIKINSASLNLFGAKKNEVIGKYNLLEDNVIEKMGFKPLVEGVFNKGEIADFIIDYNFMEVEHIEVKDATHKIIRTIMTPVFGLNKEVTNAIIQTIDLSEIKKGEMELIKAKEKAEESDKLKTAFLANMSHEIRTPMNGILGFADLLKSPGLTGDKQKKYIEIIEQSGNRMLTIISDLIDISRIETGQVEVIEEDFEINQLLEDLLVFFKPVAKRRGLLLTQESELRKSDSRIVTDKTKLTQILTNLIGNALKFTKEGQINFGYAIQNDLLQFYVRDTGVGISTDFQQKIFVRFVQENLTPANASDGSGLGLAISKAYIEKLGGRIWVESEQGEGSTFYFNLPFKKPKSDVKDHYIDQPAYFGVGKKLLVLIAEDDEISFMYLKEILSGENIQILHAINGREAIEFCENNVDINLVLMDVKMPVLNGLEATKLIKIIYPSLPVIAQSAYITARDKEIALEAGCDDYIEKPVKKEKLYALIKNYVK
ncbi:PocR ligand-binding domain-containing protein [Labilibaculum antarcticum]|uniref:histidine kinase n=1 Tax=Labilibaculum antarcticum TaxID=1717717 RepID=A0A1Y1CE74_9BACT|nr:PocR ligand-binding domain-containing protein [Labilibaculum antarcticum]BAX78423.1 hybrid sensor histidine kinase/response regulator [Labilibaculum antarcticum]